MKIVYVHSQDAWHGFPETIRGPIRACRSLRIAEIGAGANPTLPLDYVQAQGLDYTLIDISEAELAKAPDGYRKVVADAGSPGLTLPDLFDFIFSNMLAEHVVDAEQFHRNVFGLLRPGGLARFNRSAVLEPGAGPGPAQPADSAGGSGSGTPD